ncbi:MAG: type 2 isopentenyl-diphosphate Delta-isomerase [Candidatus Bilamarchaeum sp.]|jgi:isopentenyl-diphosphate delta-isomerase
MKNKTQTESRKKDHVDIVIDKGAQYTKTTSLEKFDFVHNALPEISFDQIDLSTNFFGKKLRWPIMVVGMTGGYQDAAHINRNLATLCEKFGFAMGLGSQRAMIEKPELAKTYSVREVAPNIPLIGNLGAAQLKKYSIKQIDGMLCEVGADAIAIHLNSLQEVIQPEGDLDFSGILERIETLCKDLGYPVLVKETGAGISQDVAIKLKDAGVKWLDISGAGGTSWSKVEYLRGGSVFGFEDWGIPTADAIIDCRGVLPLVASGGLRTGIDAAKCIALGADIAGFAYPFIKAVESGSHFEFASQITKQMQVCAFLTGSKNINELKKAKMRII